MALAAYRHVLRATRIAFKEDLPALHAARAQARSTFLTNRSLEPASRDATQQIAHAEEVARILRQNVVQAQRDESAGEERWRLRLHEETERGDNESVKIAGRNKLAGAAGAIGGCCGNSGAAAVEAR